MVRSVLLGCFAVGLASLLIPAGCSGSVAGGTGGETNWLDECSRDTDCHGDARCLCGVCTAPCADDGACSGKADACAASGSAALSAECGGGATMGICLASCPATGCSGDTTCVDGRCVRPPIREMDASPDGPETDARSPADSGVSNPNPFVGTCQADGRTWANGSNPMDRCNSCGCLDGNLECTVGGCFFCGADAGTCAPGTYCDRTAVCGSSSPNEPGSCSPVNTTLCPTTGPAVCGCDGVTYPNACFAAVALTGVSHPGACGTDGCWDGEIVAVSGGHCLCKDGVPSSICTSP